GDRKQPWAKSGVLPQPTRMLHHSQPCFFEEVLGHVAAPRQPQQERVKAPVERLVDRIERVGVPDAEPVDERQLGVPVHMSRNAWASRCVTFVTPSAAERYTSDEPQKNRVTKKMRLTWRLYETLRYLPF